MFKKNRKEKKNPGKILSKLISVKEKIQKKFREKFPKKKPRFHDADLHEKRYILRLAAMSSTTPWAVRKFCPSFLE